MVQYLEKIVLLVIILLSDIASLCSQSLRINEVMSSNSSTIVDEDGDFSDWIELYNASDSVINLNGYGLSDEKNKLFKWTFPAVQLKPKHYLLIFASDKDHRELVGHWETVINQGDIWKYRLGDARVPQNWNLIDYNDSNWPAGPSGFGYGDSDDSTLVPPTISLLARKIFTVNDKSNISRALLHIDCDDAFVAYLNGVEIARINIGQPGILPLFDTTADENKEAQIYRGCSPEKFEVDSIQNLLHEGKNILAIQLHNSDINSSDLTLIPFFTLGMKSPPAYPQGVSDILQLQPYSLHTNFKIKSSGELLTLNKPCGTTIDIVNTLNIPSDFSMGRKPDCDSLWFIFYNPTPGDCNNNHGYQGFTREPKFSQPGGFYSGIVELILSVDSPTAIIRYTRDGSEPDETSLLYTRPLKISSTTVIRTKTYDQGLFPSRIITYTYFINTDKTTLPVMSLSIAPVHLWDEESGIYVPGNNHEPDLPYFGANFWQNWEKPMHVEFYEPDSTPGFSIDAGVKIFGGWSRARPQKSFAIFARKKYGYSEICYPLFPDRKINKFEAFILRNSANDWVRTMFSDGMMQSLVGSLDLDIQAFRPCVIYLNGEYWGILNIREKINEHYLASHHNVDRNNIDLLELSGIAICGDSDHYDKMIEFVSNNDMSQVENYEYVKTLMDVNNFIDYNIAEIFFDNRDWPGNNIKFWRPKTKDGKWHWILYDTDLGFGLNAYGSGSNPYAYDYNTLEYASSPETTPNHRHNPPWATLLLRNLLENEEFRHEFINRFADRLNTIFRPEVVTQRISQMQAQIEQEIPRHYDRWKNPVWWSPHILPWSSIEKWYSNVDTMMDFAQNRIPHVQNHIINKFNLGGKVTLTLDVEPKNSGRIIISTIMPEQYPWQGCYFQKTVIKLTAISTSNYKFFQWKGLSSSDSSTILIELPNDTSLVAVFKADSSNTSSIVINEINYNSVPGFDADDWIELYNHSSTIVNLAGWQFKDSDDNHIFHIPNNVKLRPGDYLVLCKDTLKFKSYFPEVDNFIGNFNFGLSENGELIRLYNKNNKIIDSLIYDNKTPWPKEPDGEGPTIELKSSDLDNSIPESWDASRYHGTPGAMNSICIHIATSNSNPFPEEFALSQNYPNPFNSSTIIRYQLPEVTDVDLSIYNILGQKIRNLIKMNQSAGFYQFQWDGRNEAGHKAESGVYLYVIQTKQFKSVRKMLLLK